MKISRLVFLATWPLIAIAAEPGLEFAGVLVSDGKTLVSVRDAASGTATWVEVGQRYKGFTISGYDEKGSALVLTKDGAKTTLPLVEGKTKSAPPMKPVPPDAAAQLAALKATREKLSERYKEQHPQMVKLEREIAELEGRVRNGGAAK